MASFTNLSINVAGTYNLFAASSGDLLGAALNPTVLPDPTFAVSITTATVSAGSQVMVTVTALGPNKKSLAFGLRFRAPDRTLTDEEVGGLRQRLIDAMAKEHGAVLRG